MDISDMLSKARDSITVDRVYGAPFEKDGMSVIPAAVVAGGAGGGSGQDDKGDVGEGGGYGVAARPTGAWVIRNGEVSWRPAVDVNRVVAVVGMVVAIYLLMRPRQIRARAKAKKGRR